jgi:hypothetical protein
MELEAGTQPEGRTPRILGKLKMLGQRQMIVFIVTEILD